MCGATALTPLDCRRGHSYVRRNCSYSAGLLRGVVTHGATSLIRWTVGGGVVTCSATALTPLDCRRGRSYTLRNCSYSTGLSDEA
ncbi:hypothetical protein NDU88_012675 [Pleurodeles waltl]|uniref:Uncharacterized protein n=1 Tax=Pleurodeles waltl TaxID=8319 RepID=A0AAV7R6H3_PLEWA|nr:hypothetical protein NDU88_012675 [Pleurodeles waltl]